MEKKSTTIIDEFIKRDFISPSTIGQAQVNRFTATMNHCGVARASGMSIPSVFVSATRSIRTHWVYRTG